VIEIGINPDLFSVGSLTISWHGLLIALAILAALISTVLWARVTETEVEHVYSTAFWAVLGGIVGARLFHVLDRWDYYFPHNMLGAVKLWDGGLSLYGAILGGLFFGALYARLRGFRVGHLANITAPGVLIAQMIGRVGCLINGDAYGTPSGLPWAVLYTHPNAAATAGPWELGRLVAGHPVPIYEIIWDLFVLALLFLLWGRLRRDWTLFLTYISLYSFGRFFLSFLRDEQGEQAILGPLHLAHIISLLVIVIAVPYLIHFLRRPEREAEQAEVAAEVATEAGEEETL